MRGFDTIGVFDISVFTIKEEAMMIDPKEKAELLKGMKMVWIFWGALFLSLPLYVAIAWFLTETMPRTKNTLPLPATAMTAIFMAFSLGELVIAQVLKKVLPGKLTAMQTGGFKAGTGSTIHPAAAKYLTLVIILSAIAESIAIYGLVLTILYSTLHLIYPFCVLSAAAFIVHRPKIEELENIAGGMRSR